MNTFIKKISTVLLLVSFLSCTDLDVENKNQPNTVRVLETPDDLKSVPASSFRDWFNNTHAYDGPGIAFSTMADQHTSSWGNFGMDDLSSEPRVQFINVKAYAYSSITETYWKKMYASLSSANDILAAFKKDPDLKIGNNGADNNMVKAMSYFVQGVCHIYVGLVFDKGFIVDENTDITKIPSFFNYDEVIKAGIAKLDAAITATDAGNFTTPAAWFGGTTYTAAELKQLANSFKARALVYGSRNKAENDAVNWATVLTLAENGIQKNLAPQGDGLPWSGGTWYDLKRYSYLKGWTHIDMRIISMLVNGSASYPTDEKGFNSKYPARYDNNNKPAAKGKIKDGVAADQRLYSDFIYVAAIPHRPGRGYYHFSHYRLSKFDAPPRGNNRVNSKSKLDDLTVYENQLFIAEAKARTGDIPGALAILNDPKNPRKARGKLKDLQTSDLQVVLDAIFYERDIELIATGMGISFFDMRRRDLLQPGTLLHFPVPAGELQVLRQDLYSFGGENKDGVSTSNGGWFTPKKLP